MPTPLITVRYVLTGIVFSLVLTGCQPPSVSDPTITVRNPSNIPYQEAMVRVPASKFERELVASGGVELISDRQSSIGYWLDENGDGQSDYLLFTVSLEGGETQVFQLSDRQVTSPNKRTYAELGVRKEAEFDGKQYQGGQFESRQTMALPADHEIGNGLFKYEGPGWESDKVAYRLYFDDRNVIDIFGKRQADITLPDVGEVGAPSYHELQPWGLDILKTGPSIGLGSLAVFEQQRARRIDNSDSMQVHIRHNLPLYSEVEVNHTNVQHDNGQMDINTSYGIHAGSALTHVQVAANGDMAQWATGIVKHESQLIHSGDRQAGPWRYIATYGDQSYVDDGLGMVVFYRDMDAQTITEDDHNHLIVFQPALKTIDYYFAGYWQQAPKGIQSRSEFKAQIERVLTRLNQPLAVEVN